ncbi:MFS transporter [Candidatus Peregrinibacteria bacterium]|nr:MFS transporter [Candidatus Peregrinibacteria bacterium]
MIKKKKKGKKTLWIFAAASFLNDMGADMIYPLWPFFLTTVLGAPMAVLGFIDGLGDALVSLSQAFSGYLSDRLRRRKVFIWLGYLFGSFSRIGYAFSPTWKVIIPFRVLDRSGKIRDAPRDAMIADMSTSETRGAAFGILQTFDNFGAVTGIFLSLILFPIFGYRDLFLFASLPSIIAVLLILLFIKKRQKTDIKIYKGFTFKELSRDFRYFLFVSAIFALGSFSYSFLLIFSGKMGFRVASIPLLYLVFTFMASISSFPFGKLADRIGRKKVIFVSYFLWMLTILSFIFLSGITGLIVSFILYGLHKGGLETVQKAFASELAPVEFRASGLGTFKMVIGLFALPASFLAGILWDRVSIFAPFYFSLFVTVLSGILFVFMREKNKN